MSPNPFPLPCLLYFSFALFLAALLWTNSDLLAEIPVIPAFGLLAALLALGWRLCRSVTADVLSHRRGTPEP